MAQNIRLNPISVIVFIFILFAGKVYSQKQLTSFTFAAPVLSITTDKGVQMGLNAEWIYDHKIGFGIGSFYRQYESDNIPSDYYSGLVFFSDDNTKNEMGILYFRGIYSTRFREKGRSRFQFQLGPSLILGDESNFKKDNSSKLFSSNYHVTKTKKFTIGASMGAELDFPITRGFGIGVLVDGNVNSIKSYVGGGISLQFGITDISISKKRNRK